MSTNPHTRSEERSLTLHREIARRLESNPEILERARDRARQWMSSGTVSAVYAKAWNEILSRPASEVAECIQDPSESARALRQCTPFAGALDPRTRWRLLRSLRETNR